MNILLTIPIIKSQNIPIYDKTKTRHLFDYNNAWINLIFVLNVT